MSTYTREQIDKAKHLADLAQKLATVNWAEEFAKHLGLTVEEPKPEPGVYICDEGDIGFVDYDGDFHILNFTGGLFRAPTLQRAMAAYGARLARVVPAEVPELSEEEAMRTFTDNAVDGWEEINISPSLTRSITATVNAALAKYGHGGTTPSREDVEAEPISRTRAAYLYERVAKDEGTLPSFYDFSEGAQFAILGLIDSAIRSFVESGKP